MARESAMEAVGRNAPAGALHHGSIEEVGRQCHPGLRTAVQCPSGNAACEAAEVLLTLQGLLRLLFLLKLQWQSMPRKLVLKLSRWKDACWTMSLAQEANRPALHAMRTSLTQIRATRTQSTSLTPTCPSTGCAGAPQQSEIQAGRNGQVHRISQHNAGVQRPNDSLQCTDYFPCNPIQHRQ
jgi:hypothetical protein